MTLSKQNKKFYFWKFINLFFTRAYLVAALLILQFLIIFNLSLDFFRYSVQLYVLALLFSLIVVIYLTSTKENPAYKLAWTIFIFVIPPAGALIYLFCGFRQQPRKKALKIDKIYTQTNALITQSSQTWQALKNYQNTNYINLQHFSYLLGFANAPIYNHTQTQYLPSGESFFQTLKKELLQAEKFIFMEYFIIEQGTMWNQILTILQAKVRQGVEVRLLYDDMGCLLTLPTNYAKKLNQMGIKTLVFNRFKPLLEVHMNNRDHRKITVIDGKVGFIGGINLADEYININSQFGHWKDAAICLKGEAVWSLTVMFLQFWNMNQKTLENFEKYKNQSSLTFKNDGFVQPFSDTPQDDELVSKNVYLNLINKAKKYIYITTPYLIIDHELVTALTLAAKNGVRVKIILPAIPDKWYVQYLSQSFYISLLEAGVQIYEYLPGFIHSKTFLVDHELGVVGTINLDYRSLYLHFECGVLIYGSQALKQMNRDWSKTLDQCRLIDIKKVTEVKLTTRIIRGLLRVIAPLM